MKFPNLSRRGFIAAASALAASVTAAMNLPSGIKLLNETGNEEIVDESKEWITDKGDYYIVHVPRGKIISDLTLDKSTVFYLEEYSIARALRVEGFANVIVHSNLCRFEQNVIDARSTRLASGKERAAMVFENRSPQQDRAFIFNEVYIHASGENSSGIEIISHKR